MVNQLARQPGDIRRFNEYGRVSADVPAFAVDTGAASRALAETAGQLSGRLGKLADEAAAREGAIDRLNFDAQSGAAFLQQMAAQNAAAGKALGPVPKPSERAAAAKAYLMKAYGLADHRAAGIVGNLIQESSLSTSAVNPGDGSDGSNSIGIGQWNGSRARALHAFAATKGKPVDDFYTQLDFVMHELGTSESAAGQALARARNVDEATAAFIGFERPQGWSAANPRGGHAFAKRLANAMGLVGGGTDEIVTASTSKAAAAATQPIVPVLPTGPLALRNDNTIYGNAWDESARETHVWRLKAAIGGELAQAAIDNPDDPGALAGAIAKVQDRYAGDPAFADPQMRESLTRYMVETSQADMLSARAKAATKAREAQTAAVFEGLTSQQTTIERQGIALGANPAGDKIMQREVEKGLRSIDSALAAGSLTPLQATTAKQQLAETAATSRVRGVYEALPTPQTKEEFATGLIADWTAGKGPLAKLSYETVKSLSDALFSDARGAIGRQTTTQKVEATQLEHLIDDDIASIGASGKGLDPASGLTADRVTTLLGGEKLAAWQQARATATRMWQATSGMETQSAAEISTRLATYAAAARAGGPGATDAAAALAAASERATAILKERKEDPLGQANRAGAIKLEAIDFSTPDALAASLAKRRSDAIAVAGLTGERPTYFQSTERAYFARTLGENPAMLAPFAMSIVSTFGKDAPAALGEIADDMPVMAHAAGVTLTTGDNSVATDVGEALSAKKLGLFKAKMPEEGKIATAAGAYIGGALAFVPKLNASTMATASLLFEADANRMGFDPSKISDENGPAHASLLRAVDRALGARTLGGVKYGGVAEVNDFSTVAPPDMPAERLQELVEGINEEELAALPPIRTANGVPISAKQIRAAHLVAYADGRYRVMLGDPSGVDPQRVMGKDGKDWILDIHRLDALRRRATGAQPVAPQDPMGAVLP